LCGRTTHVHLPGFDYLGCYRYFLTFCVDRRRHAFEDPDAVALVWSQFLRAAATEAFAIIACCFMSDDTHLVAEGQAENSDLKRFISRAKQLSAFAYKQRHGKRLWQRYSYEHVLREEESTRAVVAYALENPVRARLAETVYDYPHLASSLCSRKELIEYAYRSAEGPATAGRYA
jgi:putative transposase